MRLEPIERPAGLLARIMSAAMRRQLGKTITPAKVVYNRIPRMWNVSWALIRLDMSGFTLTHDLVMLVQTAVAMENGCSFCQDIARARAVQMQLGIERFNALADWRTSSKLDERERSAIAYALEANARCEVSDETFEALRKHFGDREIAELTVATAVERFYNTLNGALEIPDDGLEAIAAARAGGSPREAAGGADSASA